MHFCNCKFDGLILLVSSILKHGGRCLPKRECIQHGWVRQESWQYRQHQNNMACHVTSNSDFDKGGLVIQINWTKALCNNCHPMHLVYRNEKEYNTEETNA